jgi:hypothetical protein
MGEGQVNDQPVPDSWLARNIQPVTVIFLLASYVTFAALSVFELETRGAYVELLGQALIIVVTGVMAGKSAEKIVQIRSDAQKGSSNA